MLVPKVPFSSQLSFLRLTRSAFLSPFPARNRFARSILLQWRTRARWRREQWWDTSHPEDLVLPLAGRYCGRELFVLFKGNCITCSWIEMNLFLEFNLPCRWIIADSEQRHCRHKYRVNPSKNHDQNGSPKLQSLIQIYSVSYSEPAFNSYYGESKNGQMSSEDRQKPRCLATHSFLKLQFIIS